MQAYEIALTQYGNQSYSGPENNPNVVKYFTEIGASWVRDDDIAWCAAFLNWCLMKANLPYTKSLLAREFLKYGKETNTPVLGDIVVLWRISKDSPWGHAGFYVAEGKSTVYILGGNQSNRVSIEVYPKTQILGYRAYLTNKC